jgi:hypothetical protein
MYCMVQITSNRPRHITLQSTGARFLRVRVPLLVSAHGTRRHLIKLNDWHATPQLAEVEK